MTVVAIAVGGAVGACVRGLVYRWYAALEQRNWMAFPLPTAGVNTIGSFILGFTTGLALSANLGETWQALIETGFCGSLTTFSTFSNDSYLMIKDGAWTRLTMHILVNLVPGLAAAVLGLWIAGGF